MRFVAVALGVSVAVGCVHLKQLPPTEMVEVTREAAPVATGPPPPKTTRASLLIGGGFLTAMGVALTIAGSWVYREERATEAQEAAACAEQQRFCLIFPGVAGGVTLTFGVGMLASGLVLDILGLVKRR